MVRTTFSLDTSHPDVKNVGNYVGDFVRFIATPPAGGSFTMDVESQAGGIGGYNRTTTPQEHGPTVPTPKLTHQDNSGSTSQQRMHTDERQNDVYTFIIDDEVTSTPTFAMTGTKTIINNSTYLGANGRITLANIIDAGGVGVDYAECLWR